MTTDPFAPCGYWHAEINGKRYEFYEGEKVEEPPPGWEEVVVYQDGKAVYRRPA